MCVCRFTPTHAHTRVRNQNLKPMVAGAAKWGGTRFAVAHTYDIIRVRRRPVLLTLPFAAAAGEGRGAGVVDSLALRRRPFSWTLTPAVEAASLASARFLARSVFQDRDFLYGTGTTNVKQPIRRERKKELIDQKRLTAEGEFLLIFVWIFCQL